MREVQLRRIAERKFPIVFHPEESPSQVALSWISLQPLDVLGIDDRRTENCPRHHRGEQESCEQNR